MQTSLVSDFVRWKLFLELALKILLHEKHLCRMQQSTEVAGEVLVDKLLVVTAAAHNAAVEEEIFQQLADFLERLQPIAIELLDYKQESVEEVVDALIKDVQSAQELISFWTSKSRIYFLAHCRLVAKQLRDITHKIGDDLGLIPLSLVQDDTQGQIDELAEDTQQAYYKCKESDEHICRTLERENGNLRTDVLLQKSILMDIALSCGVDDLSRNPSALKDEIEKLRNDVQDTKEPYDLHVMDVIENLYKKFVQSNHQPSPSEDMSNHPMHSEYRRLEPLYEAFVCPLTKVVMRDPVTLESGQTYERSAIEDWFQQCRDKGQDPVCPVTGQKITAPPKSSIALRNTIEEWTTRNEQARIDIAQEFISANSVESDVLFALKDLQVLCQRNKVNKYRIGDADLIPVIVARLKNGDEVRVNALRTLRLLAEDNEDNKVAMGETVLIRSAVKCLSRSLSAEREEAAALLFELSKSDVVCEKIGATNGAILVLVGMTSSKTENIRASKLADLALNNLEHCDINVKQMAESGRLQPLLRRLINGDEGVRIEMAEFLAEVSLTTEGKARAAESVTGVLVQMLGSTSPTERSAALRALCSLSSLESNGKLLIEAGVLPPLMRDLFVSGSNLVPMKLKEVSATILANVVSSSGNWDDMPIDATGNTLTSEPIVHNFLRLISNTGPAIETKLLQVLVGLTSKLRAVSKVVSYIKSAGATVTLIQFLEAPQPDLRVIAIKLLYQLSVYMGQEIADGLITTRQLGTLVKLLGAPGVAEEQAYTAGLLANLPMQDINLTCALLDEKAFPILIYRIEEVRKGVVRIGAGRYIAPFQKGLVGVLSRFTYALDNPAILALAKEKDLTSLFTSLLQSSTFDEVQCSSAQALENLSLKSKQLSQVPEIPANNSCLCCLPFAQKPPPPTGTCPVHGGLCSARDTFCLREAKAIVPLVACLDHPNTSLVEAAMAALSTLIRDTVDIDHGVQALYQAEAIQPILAIMQEHRTEQLRTQAVWVVERVLRNTDLARTVSEDSNVSTALVDAFRNGNYDAKQLAEKSLKALNKIPNISIVSTAK